MPQKSSITTALLLAIIPAVAIYWLTQGLPAWLSKTPATNPTQSQSVDGRVMDASAKRLLSGAAVLLELAGVTNSDTTDSEGRFLFVMTRAATPVAALLTVHAQGYQPYTLNIDLNAPELVQDIELQPQPEPPQSPVQTGRGAKIPLRVLPIVKLTSLAASVPYTKRQLGTAVKVPPFKSR